MKTKKQLILFLLSLLGIIVFILQDTYANDAAPEPNLTIATIDNRPLSIDRLIYTAFREIGCQSTTAVTTLRQGFTDADIGDKDGVITLLPNITNDYTHLRKVDVPLDTTTITVYIRINDPIEISHWDDLSGKSVGILSQREYILSRIPNDAVITTRNTNSMLLNGLLNGDYDVAVLAQRSHEKLSIPSGVQYASKLETLNEYLYLNEKHISLIPRLESSFRDLFDSGHANNILEDDLPSDPDASKTILHIISSSTEVRREELFIDKLEELLSDDLSQEWYTVALNAKRFSDDQDRLSTYANLLRRDLASRQVTAIIVSGDEAFSFVQDYYFRFFRNVPVLVYGVSHFDSTVSDDFLPYCTGVTDELSVEETVTQALRLFPGTKQLFVLNDFSYEGRQYQKAMLSQLQPFQSRLAITHNANLDFDELMTEIRQLPSDSVVLVGSYFLDANDHYYSQQVMKKILEQECSVPIFSLYSTSLEYNAVGGKCLDYERYGDIIYDRLTRLLSGEHLSDLPPVIESNENNRWVFDKLVMNRLGINERMLPADAQIINLTVPIWETNPPFMVSLLVLLVIGIGFVIGFTQLNIRYRRERSALAVIKAVAEKEEKELDIRDQLTVAVHQAPIACVISTEGRVLYANTYMMELTGINQNDDINHYLSVTENRGITRVHTRNGNERRFKSFSMAMTYGHQNALIWWGADIERDLLRLDASETARRNMQKVLDELPIPIRIVDVTTETSVYVNHSLMRLFETENPEDLIGKSVLSFMPERQPDGILSTNLMAIMLRTSDQALMELEYSSTKGNIIDARLINQKIEYYGRLSSVGVIMDIASEKEYKRLLLDAAEYEKKANRIKSELLIKTSQDIRTPISDILELTDIELSKGTSRESLAVFRKINILAINLIRTIDNILDLTQMEADKVTLSKEEFDLEETIYEAGMALFPRLEVKDVEFLLKLSLNLPHFLIGDKTRLWQIIKNLLDNAAKFTPKGTITLEAYTEDFEATNKNVTVRFTIKDTGIGIQDEFIQELFKPYRQLAISGHGQNAGSGLGLPISKQLCEMMGGQLEIHSVPDEGTSVNLSIPFTRSMNSETIGQASQVSKLADRAVLVVDNNREARKIIEGLLTNCGAVCVQAGNIRQTLHCINENYLRGRDFDIILLDYMTDGVEIAKQLSAALPNTPLLMMLTAYDKQQADNGLSGLNNIVGFIEKPFIPTKFIPKIEEALGIESESRQEPTK